MIPAASIAVDSPAVGVSAAPGAIANATWPASRAVQRSIAPFATVTAASGAPLVG